MSPAAHPTLPPARRKARLADSFVRPSLPALDALDAEHRAVIETLGELDRLVEWLDSEGVTPRTRSSARQICRFFSTHARAHHAAEERLVFPGLLRGGDRAIVEQVVRLQQDHGWLEEDWLELEPQLQAVANGFSWYDIDMLRQALPVFGRLYQDHIALEESMIYPEARRRQQLEDDAAAQRVADVGPKT